ncbi:MAG: triphosphoribosyl-dephospho-CoA synthase [Thiotrichales bacterium]|nr:triphosphoribosyl-dephospho-CoA synthase [Thiotrichales bacterium]
MTARLSDQRLAEYVRQSFLDDIGALKPGNVGRHGIGHGMSVEDFIQSAELCTPILCQAQLTVGEKIFNSVMATQDQVGCNTNLGLILLFAPLVTAAQHYGDSSDPRAAVSAQLACIDVEDTARIFRAIALANPGGLGQSPQYDVHLPPDVTIITAMMAARDRDRIAYQYVSQYDDIFGPGLEQITAKLRQWNSMEWAVTACYLNFLSTLIDSHVLRKSGADVAEQLRIKAQRIMQRFESCEQPEHMSGELLAFDHELKSAGINPGTSADLAVTSVLAYRIMQIPGDEF